MNHLVSDHSSQMKKAKEVLVPLSLLIVVPTIGLEPTRPYGHYILNVARLPIPPRGLYLNHRCRKIINLKYPDTLIRAQDETRTRTNSMFTWPSTMRVYQFRHLGFLKIYERCFILQKRLQI